MTRRSLLLTVVALAAVLAAAYFAVLFGAHTFCLRDHLTFFQPSWTHLAHTLAAGRLPEWWDGVGLGIPFAANPLHAVAYPPAWIVGALGPGLGADLLLVCHLLVGAVGAAVLSRRLGADGVGGVVAGAALALSGFAASVIVHDLPILTMAWTPWVALAADRLAAASGARARLCAAVVLALLLGVQILSGDPAFVIDSGLVAAVLALARARRGERLVTLGALAGAAVAAVAVGAFALVPAWGALAESQRAGGLDAATAGAWSLHPLRTLSFVWSHALGDSADSTRDLARLWADASGGRGDLEPGWAMDVYIGLPVLLCAILGCGARGGRALLAGAVLLLVIALGRYTPVWGLYRTLVLPERVVRYPEKHLYGALVILCVLCGAGLTRAFAPGTGPRPFRLAAIAAALLFAGVLAATAARGALLAHLDATPGVERLRLDLPAAVDEALAGGRAAALAAALFAGALALRRAGRLGAAVAAPLAALVIVGNLLTHGWSLQPLVPRAATARTPWILSHEHPTPDEDADGARRLYRPRQLRPLAASFGIGDVIQAQLDTAVENTAAAHGWQYFPGYDPGLGSRLRALWDASVARHAGQRLLALFGVKYAILPAEEAGGLGPTMSASPQRDVVVVTVPGRRPRAFVASAWSFVPDDAVARDALFAGAYDPGLVRLTGQGDGGATGAPSGPCTLAAPRPEVIVLRCRAAAASYAVLLDAWSPGWTATVDGGAAPILRAEGYVRAVPVPAGEHEIRFAYRTPGLRAGAAISLAALLLAVLLLAVNRRAGRRAGSAPTGPAGAA